jgi:hypothetical protein
MCVDKGPTSCLIEEASKRSACSPLSHRQPHARHTGPAAPFADSSSLVARGTNRPAGPAWQPEPFLIIPGRRRATDGASTRFHFHHSGLAGCFGWKGRAGSRQPPRKRRGVGRTKQSKRTKRGRKQPEKRERGPETAGHRSSSVRPLRGTVSPSRLVPTSPPARPSMEALWKQASRLKDQVARQVSRALIRLSQTANCDPSKQ